MTSLQLTTTLLGVGPAAVLRVLVRRDHVRLSHGVFWIMVAASAALDRWPALLDHVSAITDSSYPPTFLLLAAAMVLRVKSLLSDILGTQIGRQLWRLINDWQCSRLSSARRAHDL